MKYHCVYTCAQPQIVAVTNLKELGYKKVCLKAMSTAHLFNHFSEQCSVWQGILCSLVSQPFCLLNLGAFVSVAALLRLDVREGAGALQCLVSAVSAQSRWGTTGWDLPFPVCSPCHENDSKCLENVLCDWTPLYCSFESELSAWRYRSENSE